MTVQNETAFSEQNPSRWQEMLARLATFEQAMTYNPHERTDAIVSHLWHEVEKLETRVNELERQDQRVA